MSNSERHKECRRIRAENMAKDNRMHRNALRKNVSPVGPDLVVQKVSWWRRFLRWLKWHIQN